MNAWWQLLPKQFSAEQCKAIVDFALTIKPQEAVIGHGGSQVKNDDFRRSLIRWMPRSDLRMAWLYQRIEEMALMANSQAFGFDIAAQCGGFREVQFTEYNATNSGKYDWHLDLNWKKATPMDRKLSMVIQLSAKEDYQGGRLELDGDPLKPEQFAEQGDVIIFPSFNKHRVTPVTQGLRYSLVTWFLGPKFR